MGSNVYTLRTNVVLNTIRERLQEVFEAEWQAFRNGEDWVDVACQYGVVRSIVPNSKLDEISEWKDTQSTGAKVRSLRHVPDGALVRISRFLRPN